MARVGWRSPIQRIDMTHPYSSRALPALLLSILPVLTLVPAAAWSDVLSDNANFNIPAQSVRTALIEFSKQADVQVMGSSSSFGNLRSTEVKGKLRARDALSQLLQNTGLKYQAMRHAVVVRSIVTTKVKAPPVGVDVQSPTLELPEGSTSAVKALPSRDRRAMARSLHGPMQETNFSQLLGTRWPTGHATFSYEYLHRDALRAKDRKQTANSDLRSLGGTDFSQPQSSPGNIVIGGTAYAIPRRQNGAALLPSDLIAGNRQSAEPGRGQRPDRCVAAA